MGVGRGWGWQCGLGGGWWWLYTSNSLNIPPKNGKIWAPHYLVISCFSFDINISSSTSQTIFVTWSHFVHPTGMSHNKFHLICPGCLRPGQPYSAESWTKTTFISIYIWFTGTALTLSQTEKSSCALATIISWISSEDASIESDVAYIAMVIVVWSNSTWNVVSWAKI